MTDVRVWAALWLLAANLWGFCLMGFDKRRARDGGWRVRERTFFLAALLGGSAGAILGMYRYRHKTRHWYFQFGMPAILLVQAAVAAWLCFR